MSVSNERDASKVSHLRPAAMGCICPWANPPKELHKTDATHMYHLRLHNCCVHVSARVHRVMQAHVISWDAKNLRLDQEIMALLLMKLQSVLHREDILGTYNALQQNTTSMTRGSSRVIITSCGKGLLNFTNICRMGDSMNGYESIFITNHIIRTVHKLIANAHVKSRAIRASNFCK